MSYIKELSVRIYFIKFPYGILNKYLFGKAPHTHTRTHTHRYNNCLSTHYVKLIKVCLYLSYMTSFIILLLLLLRYLLYGGRREGDITTVNQLSFKQKSKSKKTIPVFFSLFAFNFNKL